MITLKRTDGSIIAECDTDSMVEAVVMNKSNLQEANLCGADLWEAYLRRASNILSLGPIGSEGRIIYIVNHGDKIMVQAGCFWGSVDELREAVKNTHDINQHAEAYNAAIDFIVAYAKAYKWADEKVDF